MALSFTEQRSTKAAISPTFPLRRVGADRTADGEAIAVGTVPLFKLIATSRSVGHLPSKIVGIFDDHLAGQTPAAVVPRCLAREQSDVAAMDRARASPLDLVPARRAASPGWVLFRKYEARSEASQSVAVFQHNLPKTDA